MPTVLSPTGKPIDCRDGAEAERVRAWAAWVAASREERLRHMKEVADMRRRDEQARYGQHPGRYLTAAEELAMKAAR